MKAFLITEIRDFMTKLLLKDCFDDFRLLELSVTTHISYHIDGKEHPAYYDTTENESSKDQQEDHVSWKELRPLCYSLIRGKHTPLQMKIVFMQNRKYIEEMLAHTSLNFDPQDIKGLYLNCQFDHGALICTSGSSLGIFTMDKSLDYAWNNWIENFFKENQIDYSEA